MTQLDSQKQNSGDLAMTSQFHIPSLDGIRAVAVVIVFLSHAGLGELIPGGFGVTIFFFLSGYLITTLMRREQLHFSAVNIKRFYLRRAYRLLPPLVIVLTLTGLMAWSGVIPHQMSFSAVASEVLYWANYFAIVNGGGGFIPYTGVVWSLSVEEHFYFFYPFLFIFCLRQGKYAYATKVFLLACGLVLLWRMVLVYQFEVSPNYTYTATDTRIDSIFWGCLMGVWSNPIMGDRDVFHSGWRGAFTIIVALIILLITFIIRDSGFRESLRYSLQGVALFPLFWYAIRYPNWLPFRPLNWAWICYLGTISYTLYLSHRVVLYLVGLVAQTNTLLLIVGGGLLTLLFSSVMYYFVERPLARVRRALHPD